MIEWIHEIIQQMSYVGILLLMLLENIFPPIPSEVILPYAGIMAANGDMNPVLVCFAATLGSILGALFWYYIGKWISAHTLRDFIVKHGAWLTITPKDYDKAQSLFEEHAGKSVFFGRLLPTIRTIISIPAGLTNMAMPRFLMLSTLGTFLWSTLLTNLGYSLGEAAEKYTSYINLTANIIIGAVIIWYIYRQIKWQF